MNNIKKLFCIVICISLLTQIVVFAGCMYFDNSACAELEPAPTAASEQLEQTNDTQEPTYIEELSFTDPTAGTDATPAIPEPMLWDDTVELIPYYHAKDEMLMSYLLYTPTGIQEGQKLPLLIWMHGSGETNLCEEDLRSTGLPSVLESMEVQPNAFILCPQLNGPRDYTYWHTEDVLMDVITLVEYIIADNPAIDTDNISIAGHSLGAIGCLHIAQQLPYIQRVACLSPYMPEIELTLAPANVRIYVGNEWYGEDGFCVTMADKLNAEYGYEVFSFLCSHPALPGAVFGVNSETGQYDTFNWLLTNQNPDNQ